MLILTRRDVEHLLTMPDAIAAVEEGFRRLAAGAVEMPQRLMTSVTPYNGVHLSMPAFVAGDPGTLTIKVVTVYNDNRNRYDLPTIHAVLLLHDARTGKPLALMDAEHLTAMRTGAVSGVATRHMARPDARVVTIFGAGVQAGPQLLAIAAVRPIQQVYVVSRSNPHDFAVQMTDRLHIPVTVAHDVRSAVEAADIICTATNSPIPLFPGEWLRAGVHINAIGTYTKTTRELDSEAVRRSRVVVDRRQAAQVEAGDIVIPLQEGVIGPEHIIAELADIVTGAVAGRTSPEEITLFKSVGLALQDAMTAALVYRRAVEQGVGQSVEL
uniref:Ornithine cyclodeaminase n=1 Tax=Caldilinea aerophila TaxID=133453 RepID=A0A7C1JY26_9CHLR